MKLDTREERLAFWMLQEKAWNMTTIALAKGRLVRPLHCQHCGKVCKPDAHHHDYSKPLDIQWLCRKCHGQAHRNKTPGTYIFLKSYFTG